MTGSLREPLVGLPDNSGLGTAKLFTDLWENRR
jgi:hypothetical protein